MKTDGCGRSALWLYNLRHGSAHSVRKDERRGEYRPGVQINPDEIVVSGTGHAEADIVEWAAANGYDVVTIGAGRPICPACGLAIAEAGG